MTCVAAILMAFAQEAHVSVTQSSQLDSAVGPPLSTLHSPLSSLHTPHSQIERSMVHPQHDVVLPRLYVWLN